MMEMMASWSSEGGPASYSSSFISSESSSSSSSSSSSLSSSPCNHSTLLRVRLDNINIITQYALTTGGAVAATGTGTGPGSDLAGATGTDGDTSSGTATGTGTGTGALVVPSGHRIAAAAAAGVGRQVARPKCLTCGSYAGRLHACIDCPFIGCWSSQHIHAHLSSSGHQLAMDVAHHEIYCASCHDYVYDLEADNTIDQATFDINHAYDNPSANNPTAQSKRKRATEPELNPSQQASLQCNSTPFHDVTGLGGLRGLYNLGSTCFMSVILQSLLHNPPLRNYFLNDMHNKSKCGRLQENDGRGICLGCDMDDLYTQSFSGDSSPYPPHHFLYSMWSCANHLAGYEQQDAHEFLVSVLDGIHTACDGKVWGAGECGCIIHKIFAGKLRSDVTCSACGFTSTAADPILDLSLDLKKHAPHPTSASLLSPPSVSSSLLRPPTPSPSPSPSPPPQSGGDAAIVSVDAMLTDPVLVAGTDDEVKSDSSSSPPTVGSDDSNGSTGSGGAVPIVPVVVPAAGRPRGGGSNISRALATAGASEPNVQYSATLLECLERFTLPEKLSERDKFFCSKCNSHQQSTKQFSVKSLPLVLCFHLKRFEHGSSGGGSATSKKKNNSSKIDTYVRFPLHSLDMAPYLHEAVARHQRRSDASSRLDGGQTGNDSSSTDTSSASADRSGSTLVPLGKELYDLFAVVVHIGTLDTGHYICYIRKSDKWYKCDDAWITETAPDTVTQSNGYLLFYIRQSVNYQSLPPAVG